METPERIDAHQHFWRFDEDQYPFLTGPLECLARDHLPEDLAPLLVAHAMDGCIAVQVRQSEEETRWMASLSRDHPFIRGVVGWVDLTGDDVADRCRELAADPVVKGMRHLAQDEPDDRWLLRTDVLRGIRAVGAAGLVYDVLIYPRQLDAARDLVRVVDDQPLVLDHIGKPPVKSGDLGAWREAIRELGRAENLTCKVSGLVTEADWTTWTDEQLRPCLDLALEVFGEDRLLFGSDWPVCTLASPYHGVVRVVEAWAAPLGATVKDKLFGGNAARVYGLHARS